MNSKKANWAFFITIVCYVGMLLVIALFFPFVAESLFFSNLACEIVVVLPVMVFALASKEKIVSFLGFRRIKFTTVLMTGLFTFLSMPLLTVLNLFSQLWVENEVASSMESLSAGEMAFGVLYLSMGIIAPVIEEITCRGAYYHSYRKSGSAFGAMIMSALIFALVHMNFNQASYAFAMGILSVLLLEATGSLWPCILYHGFINGSQTMLLYGALKVNPNLYSEQAEVITTDFLFYGIGVYLVLAAVTLPLAWAVLIWLGINEGRQGALSVFLPKRKLLKKELPRETSVPETMFQEHVPGEVMSYESTYRKTEKKDKMVSVPFVLALILCLSMMTGIFFAVVQKILQ